MEALLPPAVTPPFRILFEFAIFAAFYVWAKLDQLQLPISWGQSHFSIGQLQSSPPTLAFLAALFLWLNGGIRSLNFSWPVLWKRYLAHLLLAVAAFLIVTTLISWIHHLLWGRSPEAEAIFQQLTAPGLQSFFLLIIPLWALAEEVYYRAYLILRLEQLTQRWPCSTLVAAFLSSAVFALDHLQYGLTKLPVYFLLGLIFAGIYLYTKRSIWFVALVHWLTNTCLLLAG